MELMHDFILYSTASLTGEFGTTDFDPVLHSPVRVMKPACFTSWRIFSLQMADNARHYNTTRVHDCFKIVKDLADNVIPRNSRSIDPNQRKSECWSRSSQFAGFELQMLV